MSSFSEANQAKLSLKMLLSDYSWFRAITIENQENEYIVVVDVLKINDGIRKIIPVVHKEVLVRTEVVRRSGR